jgi:hypothetical protein
MTPAVGRFEEIMLENPRQASGVLMREYSVKSKETCCENISSFCNNFFSVGLSDIMCKHTETH